MPNGGIPRHMIMKPRYHNPHVIHCEWAVFRIYAADEWSKAFGEHTPILVLEESEARAIAAFLNYWTDAITREPITHDRDVAVEYDW